MATAEHVRMARVAHQYAYPSGDVITVVLVSETVPKFDKIRDEVISIVKDTEDRSAGTGVVMLSKGFIAAAVRAFISTMALTTSEPMVAGATVGEVGIKLDRMLDLGLGTSVHHINRAHGLLVKAPINDQLTASP